MSRIRMSAIRKLKERIAIRSKHRKYGRRVKESKSDCNCVWYGAHDVQLCDKHKDAGAIPY